MHYIVWFSQQPEEVGSIIVTNFLDEETEAQSFTEPFKVTSLGGGEAKI